MTHALRLFQGRFGRAALLDSDHDLVPHTHPQCHVLIKAGGADTAFRLRDALHPLTAESMVLVNAWEAHAKVHAPGAGRSTVLALYISPEWLAAMDPRLGAAGLRGFFPSPCVRIPAGTRRLANRVIEAMQDARAERPAEWERLLFELMTSVTWGYSAWREAAGLHREQGTRPRDARIERALSLMHEDPGARLSTDEIARACGLSRPHFFHLFRACTAVAPVMYRNALRMESAFGELPAEQTPIHALAERLGFSEPQHFTRFFRQNLGVPPSEYRRRVRLFA